MPALFSLGDTVVSRHSRDVGRIIAEPVLDAGEYWYSVAFDRRRESVVEEDLEPLEAADETIADLIQAGRWSPISAFRCAMTIERMRNTNRSTLYAFRSQRVMFQPHQYKPLLKLMDSVDRRLLIADEVGLGKTIEAGLIVTELEARQNIERVLVVCPSRLRDKWREEFGRKFDQSFQILNREGLQDYLRQLQLNPSRRRLRAIVSMQVLRDEVLRDQLEAEIGHFDVVIVDEAHHARNPETQTSEMLRMLGRVAGTLVLLTATPVHLGPRDLFTLLQAMRPTEYTDAQAFDDHLRGHQALHAAARLLRSCQPQHAAEAAGIICRTFGSGPEHAVKDPRALHVLQRLKSAPSLTRGDWIELEQEVQDLHPLSDLTTRTRKRDVQVDAAVRRAVVLTCHWTSEEQNTYQQLVGGDSTAWTGRPLKFGSVQRARQAASCLPAAMWRARAGASSQMTIQDDGSEAASSTITEEKATATAEVVPQSSPYTVPDFTQLSSMLDSKFNILAELLNQIRSEEPAARVIIFTFFVGTAEYLTQRLTQLGFATECIHGRILSDPRNPDRDIRGKRIQRFRDDPRQQILVSTEVGSEGLDFQFCHHLVNYDLPWNPMVVEQRIGRIDRFGQQSPVLNIYNLVVSGTVEERVLEKLYDRIGIFRESLGDLENILGTTVSDLERDYLSGRLTPDEADRRVSQAAFAIENRRSQAKELEQRAEELFGLEEYVRSELDRVSELGRYISENALLSLLQNFLQSQHPSAGLRVSDDGRHRLRMTADLKIAIQSATPGGFWSDRSRDGVLSLTMDGEAAFRDPSLELVNLNHPLVQAARQAIEKKLERPAARVGQALLELDSGRHDVFPAGLFLVVVFIVEIAGLRARRLLETVGLSLRNQQLLEQHEGERLLHLVTEFGQDWLPEQDSPVVSPELWNRVEAESRRRFRARRQRESEISESQYERRHRLLTMEFERNRREKQQRLTTVQERGRNAAIVKAFEAQLTHLAADYQARCRELEQLRNPSVRLSDPIAACLIHVRHVSGWKVVQHG
jgi:ERCC4-related helicase